MKRAIAVVFGAAFVGCILAANYVTTRYGMVPVGFGLMATVGTYFAGATFVLRDTIQDAGGKWLVLALIVTGAVLSYFIAAPFIALASGLAFLLSESADLAIYTPLRERGYLRAAIASNVVGAVVDTFVFLSVAGFPIWSSLGGQLVGKLLITLGVVVLVGLVRARQAVTA